MGLIVHKNNIIPEMRSLTMLFSAFEFLTKKITIECAMHVHSNIIYR